MRANDGKALSEVQRGYMAAWPACCAPAMV